MPEIQGYTGSAKTSQLFEATVSNSGTKTFLDVNVGLSEGGVTVDPVVIASGGNFIGHIGSVLSVGGIAGSVAITTDPLNVVGSVAVTNEVVIGSGNNFIGNLGSVLNVGSVGTIGSGGNPIGEVEIINGATKVDVDSRATTANGLNTLNLAEFRSGNTILTNTQLIPLQVNNEGHLLTFQEGAPADDRINNFTRQDVNSHPTTLTSHTVSTGSIFDITTWHLGTEGAITLVELQIDGTAVDAIRFDNSSTTNRLTVNYGNSAIQASGTQVVRLQTIEGDTGKEFIAGFIGNERSS